MKTLLPPSLCLALAGLLVVPASRLTLAFYPVDPHPLLPAFLVLVLAGLFFQLWHSYLDEPASRLRPLPLPSLRPAPLDPRPHYSAWSPFAFFTGLGLGALAALLVLLVIFLPREGATLVAAWKSLLLGAA